MIRTAVKGVSVPVRAGQFEIDAWRVREEARDDDKFVLRTTIALPAEAVALADANLLWSGRFPVGEGVAVAVPAGVVEPAADVLALLQPADLLVECTRERGRAVKITVPSSPVMT